MCLGLAGGADGSALDPGGGSPPDGGSSGERIPGSTFSPKGRGALGDCGTSLPFQRVEFWGGKDVMGHNSNEV